LHAHVQSFLKHYFWCVCLLNFLDLDLPKSMFNFVNADMTPKRARAKRACNFLELFDFVCHVCCVSWWKLDIFKVKIYVWVRYNRILRTAYQPFAYCVPSKKTWILRTKKGDVTLTKSLYQSHFLVYNNPVFVYHKLKHFCIHHNQTFCNIIIVL